MKVILKKIPLYESFDFDSYEDEDENFDDIIESSRYKKFLEDNYEITGALKPYKKDGTLFIDVDGSVIVKNEKLTSLTNGRFCFGEIRWDFDCSCCASLTSLKGAPEKVGGNFDCHSCKSLTSLKGAPKLVGKNFDCYWCVSLISLEGAPEKVGGRLDCSCCKALTSLKSAPKKIGGNFHCAFCDSLKSIDLPSTTKIEGEIF